MKKHVARDICTLVEEILSQMQTLNNYIIANCEPSQFAKITPVLAACVTELDIEILEPIHREYPDLKPAFLT